MFRFYTRYKLRRKELKDFHKFVPRFNYGKVIKVYDGDTITIGVYYLKRYYKFSIRLEGIDAPELRTSDLKEKEAGYFVRDRLAEKIMGQFIRVEISGYDKYGRILAKIFHRGVDICQWLLDKKWVVKYDGGTKGQPSWDHIISSN